MPSGTKRRKWKKNILAIAQKPIALGIVSIVSV
jgi:hypothetical protein